MYTIYMFIIYGLIFYGFTWTMIVVGDWIINKINRRANERN